MSTAQGLNFGSGAAKEFQKASIFEKLSFLCDEIKEGIRNLSEEPRSRVNDELERLRDESFKERAPEAEYSLRLFRKYADIANALKHEKNDRDKFNHNSALIEVPSYIYEGTAEQISGWSALGKNIFWMRTITCLFSFLAFVVMANVPQISFPRLHPSEAFLTGCPLRYAKVSGYFDYRPYQMVIAAAVLAYIHSVVFSLYYIMPVDDEGHKFLPGMRSFMGRVNNAAATSNRGFAFEAALFCRTFSKCIELFFDLFLVVITLITCMIGAISLEHGTRFDFGNGHVEYYTIGTFYNTYSHTYPICLDEDPAPKIRASLAMLFFTLFCLILCFQVSLSSFRKELKLREKARMDAATSVAIHGTAEERDSRYRIELEEDERRGRHALVSNASDHGSSRGRGGGRGGAVESDEESGVVEVTL